MGSKPMIIVDTHVIIWDALKPEALSPKARKAIEEANNSEGIIFCEISLWEIAMLIYKQRVHVKTDYLNFIQLVSASNTYIFRGITPEIADMSVKLSSHITGDPADRIIAATALLENCPLVTADQNLRRIKSIPTIW
jgi:PIN domain nuclease of toxin-antitoxin system